MFRSNHLSLLFFLLCQACIFQGAPASVTPGISRMKKPMIPKRPSGMTSTKLSQPSGQSTKKANAVARGGAKPSDPPKTTFKQKLHYLFTLMRPFTLVPAMLGVFSGALAGCGSARIHGDVSLKLSWDLVFRIVAGASCAALLNGASNVINQIYDLDIDKINKPNRPLCTGAITLPEAWSFARLLYLLAFFPTLFMKVTPPEGSEGFMKLIQTYQTTTVMLVATYFSLVYSVPALGRTKEKMFPALLSIAIARGVFMRIGGWSTTASVFHLEPWYLGGIFGLFLLGAAATKDFSDIEGDLEGGCRTLPIVFGVKRAARIMAPSFVLPWLLLPLGANLPDPENPGMKLLTGNPLWLSVTGGVTALWGIYVVHLILKDPDALATVENHPSWTHMYMMMMAAQAGLAAAYLI